MAPEQEESWESDIKETVALLRSRVKKVEEYGCVAKRDGADSESVAKKLMAMTYS